MAVMEHHGVVKAAAAVFGRIQIDTGWIDYFGSRPSQLTVWEDPEEWPESLKFTGDLFVTAGVGSGEAEDGSLSIRYLPLPTPGTILRIRLFHETGTSHGITIRKAK